MAIVLDGEQRSALAVTRSLGKKGIQVTIGAEKNPSLASSSRYCTRSFVYPSPYDDPVGFIRVLMDFLVNSPNSVLLPMTDVTLTEILSNRNEFPKNVILPFTDYDKYIQVTDKINLFRLGKELNVPIPTTFVSTDFNNQESLIETVKNFGFPVVVKPSFSKIRSEKGWINAGVYYAMDENILRKIISKNTFQRFPFLIQERIEGPGVGIFLLMKNGDVLARFAHRRIREKPPSGGVSVLSESIEPPVEPCKLLSRSLRKCTGQGSRWSNSKLIEKRMLPNLSK